MSRSLLRKLAIGLAVSLALNLFLVGVLSVLLLRPWSPGHRSAADRSAADRSAADRPHAEHHPRGEPMGVGGPKMLFRAGEAFGHDRPRVTRILREHKAELRSRWHETKKARGRVEEALRAEPFDADGLARELEGLRNETRRSQEVLHRALVEVAVEATPEQRRRLATWADEQRRPPRRPPPAPGGPPRGAPPTNERLPAE